MNTWVKKRKQNKKPLRKLSKEGIKHRIIKHPCYYFREKGDDHWSIWKNSGHFPQSTNPYSPVQVANKKGAGCTSLLPSYVKPVSHSWPPSLTNRSSRSLPFGLYSPRYLPSKLNIHLKETTFHLFLCPLPTLGLSSRLPTQMSLNKHVKINEQRNRYVIA